MPRWGLINKALGLSVPEPVETYSSSPHLYEELDIPEGTKGRLPRNKRTLAGVDAEVLEDLGETGKKNTRSSGGRDSGRDSNPRAAGGREGAREGARDTSRDRVRSSRGTGEAGRSGERRRRPSESTPAATGPAVEAAATAPSDGEQPSRTRRSRTRTRRRNGEVVAGADTGSQPGSTEA
jgi:hypothetical protein